MLVLSVDMRRDAREVKNVCQAPLQRPKKFIKTKEYESVAVGTRTET